MFTSTSPPVPQGPYYGYLLASMLVQPNAVLAAMSTSDPADVLAYQSRLPSGREALAFLNTNTSSATTVTLSPATPLSGQLRTWTYSAGHQNASNSNIVQGTASASSLAHGISLPPESMVILSPADSYRTMTRERAVRFWNRTARDRGGAVATRGGRAPGWTRLWPRNPEYGSCACRAAPHGGTNRVRSRARTRRTSAGLSLPWS